MTAALLALLSKNEKVIYLYEPSIGSGGDIIVSDNIKQILGYDPELFRTEALHYHSLIHPESQHLHQAEVQEAAALVGDSEQINTFSHKDYQVLDASGHYVWVEENKQLDVDEQGNLVGTLSLISLQAEKYQMLGELESTNKRLELAMTTSGIGTWDWDLVTDKVRCDASWSSMMGFVKPIPVVNVSRIYAMVHVDDLHLLKNELNRYIKGECENFEIVVRMRNLNGSWRYMLNRGVIFKYDENGNPLHFIGSHTDITQQKETEIAALAALGSRNQFFARVSHEIRTPMHGILGILGLLKRRIQEPDLKSQLVKVEESSEQLLFLLNDILDLAKLNETKLTVKAELTSITEVVTQVERLFKAKAQEKSLDFITSVPEQAHSYLLIDKVRITQVISNLVSNAIKFTHYGFVSVNCCYVNEELQIEVADSGIGINDTTTIFDAYTQEENTSTHGTGSTGLGLEIVKKLVDLMGLKIHVVSDGSGTKFTIDLGRTVPAKNVKKNIPVKSELSPSNLVGKRVLVVDDSDINCEIACEMLNSCGVETERAGDGFAAVKLINSRPKFDVILMDKHMPNMDGIEATQSIMKLYVGETAPLIIALTADAFDVDNEQWFTLGLSDLITKPFDADLLIQTVSRVLKKASR